MNLEQAQALVASLPVPAGLTLEVVVNADPRYHRISMRGPSGEHSLSVAASDEARVRIHWRGYCENNGHTVETVNATVRAATAASISASTLFKPGDRVQFASGSSHSGWRIGTVVRATATRVLVAFTYKHGGESTTWCSLKGGTRGRPVDLHPHTIERALRKYEESKKNGTL